MIGAYSTVPPGENGMFHSKNGTFPWKTGRDFSNLAVDILTGSAPAKLAGIPGIAVSSLNTFCVNTLILQGQPTK